MAMLAILAACHKYFACGNKVLFCSDVNVHMVHDISVCFFFYKLLEFRVKMHVYVFALRISLIFTRAT